MAIPFRTARLELIIDVETRHYSFDDGTLYYRQGPRIVWKFRWNQFPSFSGKKMTAVGGPTSKPCPE
jgi:hypothetical protein